MLFAYLILTWFGMDKLPESTVPANTLWELVNATGKLQVLKHVIDFKIFDHLSAPISADEVAGKLGTIGANLKANDLISRNSSRPDSPNNI
jgi:hypothetical protein